MAESNATSREQQATWSPEETIPQILKRLKKELQGLPPSDATKKFQTDITFVEQEYNGLPDIVAEYEAAYPGYKQCGPLYNTAECQWNEIRKWEHESHPHLPKESRKAIKDLREDSYRSETEECLNDDHPKRVLEKSQEDFRSIKSYYDQSQEEEVQILAQYNEKKAFKRTADSWFNDLKDLHGQAKNYNDKKKYRSLYAVYLEAEQVWKKIYDLTSETPAELKKKLTCKLRKVLQAKHTRFHRHKDWLDRQLAVTNAQTNYDTFKSNRRKDFIREAEDVGAEDKEAQNEGTDDETGQGPAPYQTPPSVG
jgi:hypothetical protein